MTETTNPQRPAEPDEWGDDLDDMGDEPPICRECNGRGYDMEGAPCDMCDGDGYAEDF